MGLKKPSSWLFSNKTMAPHPPNGPPPSDIPKDAYSEFDRLRDKAIVQKKKMIKAPSRFAFEDEHIDMDEAHREFDRLKHAAARKRGLRGSMTFTRGLLSLEPPTLHAREGYDDGEVVKASRHVEPKFKSRRERCVYEVRHRHAIERGLMAGLAVCLLWLTCLAVCRSIVSSVIASPKLKTVQTLVDKAISDTKINKENRKNCAERQDEVCVQIYESALEREVSRVNAILNGTRADIDRLISQRNNCSDKMGDVVLVMDFLTTVAGQTISPNFGTVTGPTCTGVDAVLRNQVTAIRAQKQAEVFKLSADSAVANTDGSFRARAAYDEQYLAQVNQQLFNSTQSLSEIVSNPDAFFSNMTVARNKTLACYTTEGVYGNQTCDNLPTLMQQINTARQAMINKYNQQVAIAQAEMNAVKENYAPLFNFFNNFRAALSRFASLKAVLDGKANDNGGGGGGLESFGFSDIDPDIGGFNFIGSGSFAGAMGTTAGANAINQQNANGVVGTTDATQVAMTQDADAARAGQTSWTSGFLSDYNPPPYDINGANAAWTQTSSQYLTDVQQNLNIVARRADTPKQEEIPASSNTTESGIKADDLIAEPVTTPLSLSTFEGIDPVKMVITWDTIANLALAMDYLYRVFRSIAIIRSYISVSAVLAPPADVRVGALHTKGVGQKTYRNPDQAMAYILTHPAVNLVFALVAVGLFSGLFLAAYLPLFNGFAVGCITENSNCQGFNQTGTMVTNFARNIAIRNANSDADGILSTAIDKVNFRRENDCANNEDRVFRQQRDFQQELDFYNGKVSELDVTVQSFRTCINAAAVDSNLTASGVLLATNNATSSTNSSLFSPMCTFNITANVRPVAFNCSNIPLCSLICAPVDQASLYRTTYDAGCTFEQYVHAGILGVFLTFIGYVLLNLARWTFLRGLRRAMLDHFAIGEFSYLATTNEHGETEYPEKVTAEGQPFQTVLKEELHETLKKYKRTGWYIIGVSILSPMPWIIGLTEFGKAFKFTSTIENLGVGTTCTS